jgi:hypothetical protein
VPARAGWVPGGALPRRRLRRLVSVTVSRRAAKSPAAVTSGRRPSSSPPQWVYFTPKSAAGRRVRLIIMVSSRQAVDRKVPLLAPAVSSCQTHSSGSTGDDPWSVLGGLRELRSSCQGQPRCRRGLGGLAKPVFGTASGGRQLFPRPGWPGAKRAGLKCSPVSQHLPRRPRLCVQREGHLPVVTRRRAGVRSTQRPSSAFW